MTLRITIIPETDSTLIKVDGRLKRDDQSELERVLGELPGSQALDLSELHSIDRSCVVWLRSALAAGIQLRAASPYIALLLGADSEGPCSNKDNPLHPFPTPDT